MVSKNQILLLSFLAFAASWKLFSQIQFSPQSYAAAEPDMSLKKIRSLQKKGPTTTLPSRSPHPAPKYESDPFRREFLKNVCLLPNLDSQFRPSSDDQYIAQRGPSEKEVLILIKSPLCPNGTHSILTATEVDNRWQVSTSLDCRHTSATDLYKAFRMSGIMTYLGNGNNELNLGLNNTSGDFLTLCDTGFVASRLGHFKLDEFDLYRDNNDCLLLTQNMEPFRKSTDLKEIALINTWSDQPQNHELLEPGRVAITLNSDDIPFSDPAEDAFIEGYVESFESTEVSALGIPNQFFQSVNFATDCSF